MKFELDREVFTFYLPNSIVLIANRAAFFVLEIDYICIYNINIDISDLVRTSGFWNKIHIQKIGSKPNDLKVLVATKIKKSPKVTYDQLQTFGRFRFAIYGEHRNRPRFTDCL